MVTEIIIGVVSSVIATILIAKFNDYRELKRLSVKDLMKKLVDIKASNTRKKQQKILKTINLNLGKFLIKNDYIKSFNLNDRRIEDVFLDICVQNDIEPTEEDYYAFSTACIYAGFIVGTMAAFAGHLFITFGKRFRESLPIKTWQRFVLSFVLTVVNAPYFVFISDTFLESLGITGFLPTM